MFSHNCRANHPESLQLPSLTDVTRARVRVSSSTLPLILTFSFLHFLPCSQLFLLHVCVRVGGDVGAAFGRFVTLLV
jgi:hypothetical protein